MALGSDSSDQHGVSFEIALDAIARVSPCLAMLVGPPGAGKSTLARELVARLGSGAAVLSYAACREAVSGDQSDPAADPQAGKLLCERVEQRCAARLTTIIDGTHHLARSRAALLTRARAAGLPAVAVVLSTPTEVCVARQQDRPEPAPGKQHGLRIPNSQVRELASMIEDAVPGLAEEGFVVLTLGATTSAR
jgi:predicted kinase